jgi:DNA-binding transcriptional MerR regulator
MMGGRVGLRDRATDAVGLNSKQVADIFGFAESTVRNWSAEFAEYLSPTATPGDRKKRDFTPDDLAVFALIAEFKQNKATYEDIHLSLKAGQRGMPPEISEDRLKLISATEGEKRASLEIVSLQRHIADLTELLRAARAEAAEARALAAQNASLTTQVEMLTRERDEAKAKLDGAIAEAKELNRQLGREYTEGFREGFREGRGETHERKDDPR